ncbi:MAG TPA: M23 family metallopeptidase [Thermoleophilaceae bacterium]|nr:M23 family metallopeptidase [Thermoleophilaceae bacterium]
MPRALLTTLVVLLAVLAAGGPAHADQPRIRAVECIAACADGQPRGGSLLLVSGTGLGNVYTAVFPGGRDGIRDLRGRAGQTSSTAVRVRVPWEAASGSFVLGTRDGMVSRARRLKIAPVPVVSKWTCIGRCAPGRKVRPGSLVLVRGLRLGAVRDAVLQGGRGRADDLRARVSNQRFASFRMRVPDKAITGNFSAREPRRRSPGRRLTVQAPAPVPVPPGAAAGVFPVRGTHDFGSAGSRFGAGRSGHTHQGQDVMAACGVPLVSATPGTVQATGYQSAAGNYLVIRGSAPVQDYVYMHLPAAPLVKKGAVVAAGQPVGAVGRSGNAQGCHLHFEIWSAPGWYDGGAPFDPLPQLQAWEAAG